MSIRAKLLLSVLIAVAGFCGAVAVYFGMLAPAEKIAVEQETVAALRTAILAEQNTANGLATNRFSTQTAALDAAFKKTNEAFEAVKALTVLPRMSGTVRQSLETIKNLQAFHDSVKGYYDPSYKKFTEKAQEFYGSTEYLDYTLLLTFARGAKPDKGKEDLGSQIQNQISNLLYQVGRISDFGTDSVQLIEGQSAAISKEVKAASARSGLISTVISVSLIVASALIALLLTGRIARSVRSMEGNVAAMKGGDLTRTLAVRSRDEMGRLAANLNGFMSSLRESLAAAQSVSSENLSMKESLVVTTEQTSASAAQISASVDSIDRQIASMDQSVLSAASAVENITGNITSLDAQIIDQTAMVEESTASVTEMFASIDNVARISNKRREAAGALLRTVAAGGEKTAATAERVSEINKSIGAIKNITAILRRISSQTNLLAMNAAIEAAHAGDVGRGFSVVADEIRTLADASLRNSKEIDGILKQIVGLIGAAASSSGEMKTAFGEMDREMKEFSASLSEIFDSMNELHIGGDQILTALTRLSEVTANVKAGSASITGSSARIRDTMSDVQRISSEVRGGMAEISAGIREISTAVQGVLNNAERLGQLGESLNKELARFKTSE